MLFITCAEIYEKGAFFLCTVFEKAAMSFKITLTAV